LILRNEVRIRRANRAAEAQAKREVAEGLPGKRAKFDQRTSAILDKREADLSAAQERHTSAKADIHRRTDSELAAMGDRP
jgi:hypothetical protein